MDDYSMAEYRLYCLNESAGIDLAQSIEAQTDAQAVAIARTLKHDTLKCEVWGPTGLVATLEQADLRG